MISFYRAEEYCTGIIRAHVLSGEVRTSTKKKNKTFTEFLTSYSESELNNIKDSTNIHHATKSLLSGAIGGLNCCFIGSKVC